MPQAKSANQARPKPVAAFAFAPHIKAHIKQESARMGLSQAGFLSLLISQDIERKKSYAGNTGADGPSVFDHPSVEYRNERTKEITDAVAVATRWQQQGDEVKYRHVYPHGSYTVWTRIPKGGIE